MSKAQKEKRLREAEKEYSSLVGKYFHSFDKEKLAAGQEVVQWQGVVLGSPAEGYYIVLLFEWLAGNPTVTKLVAIEDMVNWQFYSDDESMGDWYQHHYEPRARMRRYPESKKGKGGK